MPKYIITINDPEAARVHEDIEADITAYKKSLSKKIDNSLAGKILRNKLQLKSLFTFEWTWKTASTLELYYAAPVQAPGKELKDEDVDAAVKTLAEWGMMTIERINEDGTKVLING